MRRIVRINSLIGSTRPHSPRHFAENSSKGLLNKGTRQIRVILSKGTPDHVSPRWLTPRKRCRKIERAWIRLASTRRKEQFFLPANPWYGRLLNIGSEGGYPILTFTTARADLQANPNPPNQQYVKVMASGIKETYPPDE